MRGIVRVQLVSVADVMLVIDCSCGFFFLIQTKLSKTCKHQSFKMEKKKKRGEQQITEGESEEVNYIVNLSVCACVCMVRYYSCCGDLNLFAHSQFRDKNHMM